MSAAEGISSRPDAESFEAFYLRTRDTLLRTLTVTTGSRPEAEDISQEAFVRVWERWDKVRRMEAPDGYLFRVGFNLALDSSRRMKRVVRYLASWTPSSSDGFVGIEVRTDLERAIMALPPRQRAALIAMDYLGFDSPAAAQILGVRPGTVRRLASKARMTLATDERGLEVD